MQVKADIHIHTVLSPCGDIDMSPLNIVKKADELKLDIIGISDHNSTLQAPLIQQMASEKNIFALMGAEVTTKEEVHCLCFFETGKQLNDFQDFIDAKLNEIPNNPDRFGHQLLVNEKEEILKELPYLLLSSLNAGIEEISRIVKELEGLFIPAHIDRPRNSLISQLGFLPPDLHFDALEIHNRSTEEDVRSNYMLPDDINLLKNSDAHYTHHIGQAGFMMELEKISFQEIRKALHNSNSIKTFMA